MVRSDCGQLQQIILNLVRNAADAMDSVSGRARVLWVKSAIYDPDGVLLVSVKDSGTGIDPKDMNRIFDSFFTTKSQRQSSAADLTRRSMRSIGLTAAVGLTYFLAAKLGIGLPSSSGFVSVFWPAFGLSSGVLIALGPRARWPVGAGVILGSVAAHLNNGDPLWVVAALALGSAAETLITAGLIERKQPCRNVRFARRVDVRSWP